MKRKRTSKNLTTRTGCARLLRLKGTGKGVRLVAGRKLGKIKKK